MKNIMTIRMRVAEFMKKAAFKSQGLNALVLYLAGVLTLALFAYGCKALLNFL